MNRILSADLARLRFIALGVAFPFAVTVAAPLSAQDIIREYKPSQSATGEETVTYNDLNLNDRQDRSLLVSRVRKAAGRVCNIVYRGYSSLERRDSRCPHKIYRGAKPQIDFAIANANSGYRVAINVSVAQDP